jgi:1-deoxy-D-xylulose-5-phosphate reductoisomerase
VVSSAAPRRITVLGATGSIGDSVASVVEAAPDAFRVEALVAGRDAVKLAARARAMKARLAVVADEAALGALREALSGSGIAAAAGQAAVIEAAERPVDCLVGAIAGAAGLAPTAAAIAEGTTVALANKETLVCAGHAVMALARQSGARLLPLDSEHNAIFQALGGLGIAGVERITLTASGGPFRTWSAEAIESATVEAALKHPTWVMGPKVTIDSASLMNKGLELVEAMHLFGAPAAMLDVLVHPQSAVHGLVSFVDGSVTAGLAASDMRVAVAHCLAHPERLAAPSRRLDLAALGTLTFEKPDLARFPCLALAMAAMAGGGRQPTVLNAANEIAVEAFLAGRIRFGAIARLVERVLDESARDNHTAAPATVAEAMAVDHVFRNRARALLPLL